jgi:spermidine synthase
MEGLTQPFLPAQPVVGIQLGCRLGGDHPVHNNILELHWSKAILPCKFMDFNLQAYQADHLLHLSAKPERRVSVLENARHRWLEMDGVVQSAMSLHQPARLCLPHQRKRRIFKLSKYQARKVL